VGRQAATTKALPRRVAGVDADEAEALAVATATLKGLFPNLANAELVTHAVISSWIIERMKRHTAGRLNEHVVFNLDDAKLTGMVEAALPKIGGALADAGFPFDATFGDLTKPQAVTLFLAGVVAHREAAVAAGEACDFPFDIPFSDPIPFPVTVFAGSPLTNDEVPW
jgi:hypothetical protein